jgi:hypothetical protein
MFLAALASAFAAGEGIDVTPGCPDREKGLVRIRTQMISNEEQRVVGTKYGTGFVTAIDGVVKVVTAAHVISSDPPNSPSNSARSAAAWGCTPADWRPIEVESSGFEGGIDIDLAILRFAHTAPGGMTPIGVAKPAGVDGAFSLWGYPDPNSDSSGSPAVAVVSPASLNERMSVDRNFPAGVSGSPLISAATGRAVGAAVNRNLSGLGSDVLMFVARNSWLLENGLGAPIEDDAAGRPAPLKIDVSYNSFAEAFDAALGGDAASEPPEIWFSVTNLTQSPLTITQIRLVKSTRSVYKSLPRESTGGADAVIDLGAHAIKGPNVNLNPDRTFRLGAGRLQGFRVALDAAGVSTAAEETKRDLGAIGGFRDFTKPSACGDLGRRVSDSDFGDWRLVARYVDAKGDGADASAVVYDFPLAQALQPLLGASCALE